MQVTFGHVIPFEAESSPIDNRLNVKFGWLFMQPSYDNVQTGQTIFIMDVCLRGKRCQFAMTVDVAKHRPVLW